MSQYDIFNKYFQQVLRGYISTIFLDLNIYMYAARNSMKII